MDELSIELTWIRETKVRTKVTVISEIVIVSIVDVKEKRLRN